MKQPDLFSVRPPGESGGSGRLPGKPTSARARSEDSYTQAEGAATFARDKAIESVEKNNQEWNNIAWLNTINYLRIIKKNQEFSGELLRSWLAPTVGQPPDPHCMGAFVMRLVKNKVIAHTGSYAPMQSERSHGRESKIYRWTY